MISNKGMVAMSRFFAIILIALTLIVGLLFLNRAAISDKLGNLLPSYGFDENETLGVVGDHVPLNRSDISKVVEDLLDLVKNQSLEHNNLSNSVEIVFDQGGFDVEDRVLLSWNFTKEEPFLIVYPNSKNKQIIFNSSEKRISGIPKKTHNNLLFLDVFGKEGGFLSLSEMISKISSPRSFTGKEVRVGGHNGPMNVEEVLRLFLWE